MFNAIRRKVLLLTHNNLILSFLAMLPSIWWVSQDQTVWPWDQAWYGEVSVELWSTLTWRAAEWPWQMVCAQAPKAPGLAWLGQFFVPLGEAFGSVELGLMALILVLQFFSLALTASIGKSFSARSNWMACAGMMSMASAPIFIGMSHQYMTEALQCLAVTYFYWIAVYSNKQSPFKTLIHLLLAAGLALTAKTTSPLYCLLPALLALVEAIRIIGKTSSFLHIKELSRTMLATGGSGVLLFFAGAGWYWHNLPGVWHFVKIASTSDIALDYGSRGTFLHKLGFWTEQSAIALSTFWSAWILLGILTAGLFCRFRNRSRLTLESRRNDLLALASLGHVLFVLTMFSFQINEETRYLLPILPAVVVLLLWSLSQFPHRARAVIAMVACGCLVQWGWVHAGANGLVPPTSAINAWVKPYESDSGKRKEIARIVQRTSTRTSNQGYNICGVELPWLNANNLEFYASIQGSRLGYRAMYTSLGYAEKNVENAWNRLQSMNIHYYISLEASSHPAVDFLNQTSLPVLIRVSNDPRFLRLDHPSTYGVLLFQNTAIVHWQ